MSLTKALRKNKLLVAVILAYIILFITMPDKGTQSLKNSMYYVIEMLEIIPVIFIITSLIEAWVPKKVIMNSFGDKSGIKGGILSFVLGSFSAGPIYAAFPVCKMLMKKGASIMNIVIILSTWAVVKVPMLINESKFLGLDFMGIRWILTTISIFIMAYLMSVLVKRDSIPLVQNPANEINTLEIMDHYCIGCGVCNKLSPEIFVIIDGKAQLIHYNVQENSVEMIKEVVEKCPTKAIQFN